MLYFMLKVGAIGKITEEEFLLFSLGKILYLMSASLLEYAFILQKACFNTLLL